MDSIAKVNMDVGFELIRIFLWWFSKLNALLSLFVSLSTFFTLCGKIVNQLCLAFAGFILGIGL